MRMKTSWLKVNTATNSLVAEGEEQVDYTLKQGGADKDVAVRVNKRKETFVTLYT